jgi:hypothetical protein
MDFVLLGYSPEMVRKMVAAADGHSMAVEEEYNQSRLARGNLDQNSLNQVCY